jgi:hypothetical protein
MKPANISQLKMLANARHTTIVSLERENHDLFLSKKRLEAREIALMKVLLEAEMVLSELRVDPSEKCQIAYELLNAFRTSQD